MNPPYSGSFAFYFRSFLGETTQKKVYFYVNVNPDTITDFSYKFAPSETVTTLYPNSNHLYVVSFATVNAFQSVGGNSYVLITLNNIFTLASTYCQITTTATSYDSRGIFCQLTQGGSQVYLKNLADVPAGSTFNITLELISTSVAATVSPTVNIQTYWGNGALVDQALNVPFKTTPLTNTNLTVLTSFSLPSAWTSTRAITANYFGHLLVNFDPLDAWTVLNGTTIILTMPTGFFPGNNTLGLPLRCQINGVRFSCTYTLSPFTITIAKTNSSFSSGLNVINITTEYQNKNGIQYPSTQGRYVLQLEIQNTTFSTISLEKVQQFVDILPGDVGYFNVSWAVRDMGVVNIYTVEFKNGQNAIPSYNDATTAGRIYIGFPMIDSLGNQVFTSNLGFTGYTEGQILPCYFDTGSNFVTATSGKVMYCKIRMSRINKYFTWIEIVNFAAIPAGTTFRVIIGKITNPSLKQIDINFQLKINSYTVSTAAESALYQTDYNMFIDMVSAAITNRN